MEQLVVHCRGKVVPGRKAAVGSEPNATVISVREAFARAVQQETMWQRKACWDVLAPSGLCPLGGLWENTNKSCVWPVQKKIMQV